MKQDRNCKTRIGLVLFAALVCILPAQLHAQSSTPKKTGSAPSPKSHTTPKRTGSTANRNSHTTPRHRTRKAAARTSQHRSTHHPATRRVSSTSRRSAAARRRRAQLRPEPERIQQIQQALLQAGYLSGQPNGRWDDQTREGMRRFQADHGFPTTGLPEAKSLMKLGLGPHPLPEGLDTSATAKASGNTADGAPAPPDAQQSPP